jgi:hypothetical protein
MELLLSSDLLRGGVLLFVSSTPTHSFYGIVLFTWVKSDVTPCKKQRLTSALAAHVEVEEKKYVWYGG